jgi:tetratricopeptide (TPR) repeat protein
MRSRREAVSGNFRGLGAYVVCVVVSLAFACRRPATPPVTAPPPAVEWSGCDVVWRGPRCALGPGHRLTVWLGTGPEIPVELRTDRGALGVGPREAVPEGSRLVVEPPAGARWLEAAIAGQSFWRVELAALPVNPALDEARALASKGAYQEAARRLQALREITPAAARGPVNAALGRAALNLGDITLAESSLRAAVSAARADGRVSDVVKDGFALFWALVTLQQHYVEARALMTELTADAEAFPEGRVYLAFNRGVLAEETGDFRRALDELRAAERLGQRLGLERATQDATAEIARALVRLGRNDEAVDLLGRVSAKLAGDDPCALAQQESNVAWALMERASRQEKSANASLAAALASARSAAAACPQPQLRQLVLINEAEYALARADVAGATAIVAGWPAPTGTRSALLVCWEADVRGRLALLQGRADRALAFFEEQRAAARASDLAEEGFRAQVGAGRALLALGRKRPAVDRLREARGQLDRMLAGIPLGEGRGTFLGTRDEGVRYLVAALLEVGAAGEAMAAARMARAAAAAQAVRLDRLARLGPDERQRWDQAIGRYWQLRRSIEAEAAEDWTLPRQKLALARARRESDTEAARAALDEAYRVLGSPASARLAERRPGPGELQLAFFPGPHGWFGFAASARAVRARAFEETDFASKESAARVLAQFSAELSVARRVSLFTYGAADRPDWQSIPWRGQPLVNAVELEWIMDAPAGRAIAPAPATPPHALVVADPTQDLAAARREGQAVAEALGRWPVQRLEGSAATREAMLAALERASLFHYAGHAELAGTEGMSSALVAAGRARVELRDLLALRRVPGVVFLSACDAVASTATDAVLGLGQAFLAAGADVVVAPVRPVRDEVAYAFASGFYRAVAQQSVPDVHAAFRRSTLELASSRPDADWSSFRLLVP